MIIPSSPKVTTAFTSATLKQMIAEHGQPTMTHRDYGRDSYSWVKEDRKLTFYPSSEPATLLIEDR